MVRCKENISERAACSHSDEALLIRKDETFCAGSMRTGMMGHLDSKTPSISLTIIDTDDDDKITFARQYHASIGPVSLIVYIVTYRMLGQKGRAPNMGATP